MRRARRPGRRRRGRRRAAGGEDDKAGAREPGGEWRRIRDAEATPAREEEGGAEEVGVDVGRLEGGGAGAGGAKPRARAGAQVGMRPVRGRSGVLRGGGPMVPRRSGAKAERR